MKTIALSNGSNLRVATQSQNHHNTVEQVNNSSGCTGVSYRPARPGKARAKWRATIMVDGVTHNLGEFAQKDDAIAARRAAEQTMLGAFAPKA